LNQTISCYLFKSTIIINNIFFLQIERAIVIANERGQSTNEGVVEFVRKPGAQAAIRRCTDGCFFLTSSLRPVVVEPMEQLDDEDGFSERAFAKKTTEFLKEREVSTFHPSIIPICS